MLIILPAPSDLMVTCHFEDTLMGLLPKPPLSLRQESAIQAVGLKKDAVYINGPDGYVSMADGDVVKIKGYMEEWRIN